MENYSLLIIGDSSGDEDGGGVDGDAFRGHFPVSAACRNRDLCPPNLGFFLRENLLLCASYLPLGVAQRTCEIHAIMPLCVVLVINDNPYGLMFSLSLYEVIFHRYYL